VPNTIYQAIAYARTHPRRRDGNSWVNWCEAFVFWTGGFTASFPSALLAGDASGPLNPAWADAPRGSIHYWAGAAGDGHVAFELGGGLLLMAWHSVTDRWGVGTGTVSFHEFAKRGLPYRGWSVRHGTETLAGIQPSTFGRHILLPELRRPNMLYLVWDTHGTGYLVTANGTLALTSMDVYNLFRRLINSKQNEDRPELFTSGEMQVMDHHLGVLAKRHENVLMIDVEKLASSVVEKLAPTLTSNPNIKAEPNTALESDALVRAIVDGLGHQINALIPRIAEEAAVEQGRRLGRVG
jgi:hypothetical protein